MKSRRQRLVSNLDKVVSLYVRKSNEQNGLVQCYTCPNKLPYKEIHCGHFVKRSHMATRWDLRNLRPQCPACNLYRDGNQDEFAVRLQYELGDNILKELWQLKHSIRRWSLKELQDEIDKFKKMLSDYEERQQVSIS